VSRPTQGTANALTAYVYGIFTLYDMSFQNISTSLQSVYRSPTTPVMPKHGWFRLIPVRSPLLRESLLFSFPPGNEMFQFPGFAPCITWYPPVGGWVAPFGYLRINCYLHIPAACRSLSRPSSPQRAKASSVRPYLLSLALGTNITVDTGFLLYAFLLKLCFFQYVNELYPINYELSIRNYGFTRHSIS
jgi:hypothetical protein